MKSLRARLRTGETLFGCFLNLGSALTAEIVGLSGFDWVLIDLEHGAGFEGHLLHQLQALEHTPAAAIVRIESAERPRFHRVLDLGASGVMVPRIDDSRQARTAVAALRFPPQGVRGIARMNRACGFGAHFETYFTRANDELLGVLQIESQESLQHVDDIASVDGVDVLFVGPSDLSQSLGRLGQYAHPRYQEALCAVAAAAQRHGKAAGILMSHPDERAVYQELGYRFLACGSDSDFVGRSARELLTQLRKN